MLANTLSGDSAQRSLVEAGADSRYTVAPDIEFGSFSPIVKVTGIGGSPEAAVGTTKVVGAALTRELDRMQTAEGVAPEYMITTQQVGAPVAQLQASGTLRALVGVLALGAILLFLVVSVVDGLAALRMDRAQRAVRSGLEAGDEPMSARSEPVEGLSGFDAAQGSGLSRGSLGRDLGRDLADRARRQLQGALGDLLPDESELNGGPLRAGEPVDSGISTRGRRPRAPAGLADVRGTSGRDPDPADE